MQEAEKERSCLKRNVSVCVCVRGALQAPLDLLLLVYKRVQSVKLLLLRVRQSFAKVENETLQANGSAGVSQICSVTVTTTMISRDIYWIKKKGRKEKK